MWNFSFYIYLYLFLSFQDSSVLAQLGWPDMRLPILYTMSWPDRIYCSEVTWPRLDLCKYIVFPQSCYGFKLPVISFLNSRRVSLTCISRVNFLSSRCSLNWSHKLLFSNNLFLDTFPKIIVRTLILEDKQLLFLPRVFKIWWSSWKWWTCL